jgi:hypothetical protein
MSGPSAAAAPSSSRRSSDLSGTYFSAAGQFAFARKEEEDREEAFAKLSGIVRAPETQTLNHS